MYQALYRKYRPLRFADVIGQRHITDTLRNQVQTERLSHAYLFTGTRGTGKTTCAKILARAVNCEHPENGDPCGTCQSCRGIMDGSVLDVLEIDAASNNGVDNIRDMRDEAQYTPASVKKRVYIVDEVHMLSQGAFNALLKTLEEPPAHVLFILATTEIQKVPATIQSRCQRFDFRRISPHDIAACLLEVAQQEGISLTNGGAVMIARLADGAMRDALSILDRTAARGVTVDEEVVSLAVGVLGGEHTVEIMSSILQGNLTQAVELMDTCYLSGRDLAATLDQLLSLIRDMLLVKAIQGEVGALLSPAYTEDMVRELCSDVAASTLIAYTRVIQDSLARLKNAANRRVEAELCVMRLCILCADEYDTLSGRVEALEEKLQHGLPAIKAVPAPSVPQDKAAVVPAAEKDPMSDAKKPKGAPQELWPQWPKLLDQLQGKMPPRAYTHLKNFSKAMYADDTLVIIADDSITAGQISPDLKAMIAQGVLSLLGQPCKVCVRENAQTGDGENATVDDLLRHAKKNGVEVTIDH